MSPRPQTHPTTTQQAEHPQALLCLPLSLRLFLFAILGFTIVSLSYSLIARELGLGLPYSFPGFFNPRSFLADFFEFRVRFYDFGKPTFFTQHGYFMYPPAMVLPLKIFYDTAHPFWTFPLFLLMAGAFFTLFFFRILRKERLGTSASALLALGVAISSYPYMFLLERGNTEVFVWISVTLGLWAFYRGHYFWASAFLGMATAFKIYPFVFFGLFLPRKRYLEIAVGVLTTIAITVIALRALSSNIAYAFAWDNVQLQAFGKYYAAAPQNLGYDHSLFSFVKFVTLPWHPDLTALLRPFTWLVAAACLLLYFGRIWKLPLFNQILSLSILSVCIAPVSYDYTLLSLYAALAILCVAALHTPDKEQSTLLPFFLLFAAVLTPLNFVIFHGAVLSGQLRALLLVALLALALSKPLPASPAFP